MSPSVVRDLEVTISLVSEQQSSGTRWFASAQFHGYADEDRISGLFDYSYTPYPSAAAAAQDAVVRTKNRLAQLFGLPVDPLIKMAPGSPTTVSALPARESPSIVASEKTDGEAHAALLRADFGQMAKS